MKKAHTWIYGRHVVLEALRQRADTVREVAVNDSAYDTELAEAVTAAGLRRTVLEKDRIPKGVDPDAVHQGVLARINIAELTIPYKRFIGSLSATADTALLVLGEVQDPQNVGAVIRSAAAFGIAGVLVPPHRQAQLSAAVVKVSAGMVFHVPIVSIGNVNTTLRDLKERGFWTYGLASDGETDITTETFERPSVFVLGNENEGLRKGTRDVCDQLLSIPMRRQSESLNASASTAVVLYEWAKQHKNVLT